MKVTPGPRWEELIQRILHSESTILLLGNTDSGKSTLARFILYRLLENHLRVALVDTDIGQSSLFLPGTVSMKVFTSTNELNKREPDGMFFVGLINPARNISFHIKASEVMLRKALERKPDKTIVDTTGLVTGSPGHSLKKKKILTLKPSLVVALQRGSELEGILKELPDSTVFRLLPSEHVRPRTREERINYRNSLYREYFKDSYLLEMRPEGVQFEEMGRRFSIRERYLRRGTLLGLCKGSDTLGLGIFDGISDGRVQIITPLKEEDFDRIVVGEIVIPEEIYSE
jgi:polynucleotide 5'-hydroxyl-kinase GRC3/NOL9